MSGIVSWAGVRGSAVVGDDIVYVGRFTSYTDPDNPTTPVNRWGFVVLNRHTMRLSARDFDPNVNGSIEAIDCVSTTCVAVGGFTRFRGVAVNQAVKFDLATGAVDTNFKAPEVFQGSYYTVLYRGGIAYVGGSITRFVNGRKLVSRSYAAALNDRGALTSWAPRFNHSVYKLRMSPGGALYAAGEFDMVNEVSRQGFAAISTKGTPLAWNPAPPPADTGVVGYDIAFYKNFAVLAGDFATMGGVAQHGLAMVDAGTGAASAIRFATQQPFIGTALQVIGDSVYAGFGSASGAIGGHVRQGLAEVDLRTGLATPFQADVVAHENSASPTGVLTIHVLAGNQAHGVYRHVYVTGNFADVAGSGLSEAARIDQGL